MKIFQLKQQVGAQESTTKMAMETEAIGIRTKGGLEDF
jgi:hypothetical protein